MILDHNPNKHAIVRETEIKVLFIILTFSNRLIKLS